MSKSSSEGNQSSLTSDGSIDIDEVVNSFIESSLALARNLDANEELVSDFVESSKGIAQLVKENASRSSQAAQQSEQNSANIESLEQELSETRQHSGKERAELNSRLNTAENDIDEIDGTAATEGREGTSSEDNPHTMYEETTSLERVCALPEQAVESNLSKNQQRARSVARRIDEYGKKVPAGIAITSSRIKRVLTAQEDSTIHRQTVSRVADFLKRFGEGEVGIKETRSGKKTVVFTEELVEAVTRVVTQTEAEGVTEVVV